MTHVAWAISLHISAVRKGGDDSRSIFPYFSYVSISYDGSDEELGDLIYIYISVHPKIWRF